MLTVGPLGDCPMEHWHFPWEWLLQVKPSLTPTTLKNQSCRRKWIMRKAIFVIIKPFKAALPNCACPAGHRHWLVASPKWGTHRLSTPCLCQNEIKKNTLRVKRNKDGKLFIMMEQKGLCWLHRVWVKRGDGGNVGTEAGLHCCRGVGQGKQGWLKTTESPVLKWDRPVSGQGLAGGAEDEKQAVPIGSFFSSLYLSHMVTLW